MYEQSARTSDELKLRDHFMQQLVFDCATATTAAAGKTIEPVSESRMGEPSTSLDFRLSSLLNLKSTALRQGSRCGIACEDFNRFFI